VGIEIKENINIIKPSLWPVKCNGAYTCCGLSIGSIASAHSSAIF